MRAVDASIIVTLFVTACGTVSPEQAEPEVADPELASFPEEPVPRELLPEPGLRSSARRPAGLSSKLASGALVVAAHDGEPRLELPLVHTEVEIDVTGFAARARVVQQFVNPFEIPIEAVYVFPLPEDAAVDAMTMRLGERVIEGEIKTREEARSLYDDAKKRGKRAALLEQERDNVFTQSVANIMPGDAIEVEISYVDILRYDEGSYELVFPMAVGPRYIPGAPLESSSGGGFAPDTDRVPDASRITPAVLPPSLRSGHDIALTVTLDAGLPIRGLHSISHALSLWELSPTQARIALSPADTVPNKDFILRYEVAGERPQAALLTHYDERGGYFTLVVEPQRSVDNDETLSREMILIADTSGSMAGEPIEQSKQVMQRLLRGMRRSDRFNVVRFSGDTGTLFETPQTMSPERLEQALAYVDDMEGSGGTEMAAGIVEALSQPAEGGRLRLAVLLTDGFVDEAEVLQSIRTARRAARLFTVGIGSSPNRYLLDRAALLGRGEAFYLRQDEEPRPALTRLFKRLDRPALCDIAIDWKGLEVFEVYPARIPDLFAGQPLRLHGRYARGGAATIEVSGRIANGRFVQEVPVSLPATTGDSDDALASVWARQKIKHLSLDLVPRADRVGSLREEVTRLGLDYHLVTRFTSFVAVDEQAANEGGALVTVNQPVALPEGVSYEGVFGAGAAMGGLGTRGTGSGPGAGGMGFGYGGAGLGGGGSLSGSFGIALGSSRSVFSAAQVEVAAPVVLGALPPEVIKRVIDANRNQIRYCYESELQIRPDLAGRVSVKLVIGAQGEVVSVVIKESSLANAAVESCIVDKIKTWAFPAPSGGGVIEVNYPFIFAASP